MIYEIRLEAIIGIRDGELLYESDEGIKRISLKESADIWWDNHHKATIWDRITQKKSKNRYVGGKWYNLVEPYIKMYSGDDEIVFKKKIPEDFETSDACELRMWWDGINVAMNQIGFWLFDEG